MPACVEGPLDCPPVCRFHPCVQPHDVYWLIFVKNAAVLENVFRRLRKLSAVAEFRLSVWFPP
jgi:hypothetical protein